MSVQIAVRLPEDLVLWVDQQVAAGGGSRAAVTARALRRYRRQLEAEHDADIYRRTNGYPELYQWAGADRAYPDIDS